MVLAKEDKSGNKFLVAYIMANQEIEESHIKNILSKHLPDYMIPVAYKRIDSMPLTPNGKVDKKALAKVEVEIQSTKEYIAPRDEIEEKLAQIFQEVLNVERVGIEDNFFELGGHSLLATQLVSRIRNDLGIELPLKELFGRATIKNLSEYLQLEAKRSSITKIARVKNRDNLTLSYSQERLWFLDKFEEGKSTTYHISAVLKLEGSLDKNALNKALKTIVKRHEALRTNFIEKDNITLQKIGNIKRFRIEEIECKESSIEKKIKETLSQPFNLESDMLFKTVLYSISEQRHYLLVNMHHIISDGWSLGILVEEFVTLYRAYSNNQKNPLPLLKIQYGDYANWQKEYLSGEVLNEKLEYWKDTLSGIEPLALPTTYPRPAIQSNRGDRLRFTIGTEITQKLNSLSKTYDVTLFMTLLSSFGLLLHRYSGQEEFIIGSPIANRNRSEIEPLIGFFVNTLALKQEFSSDIKFTTLLQQTKEYTLSAYEHQDVPFEKIVDALDIPRDTSRSPLFQVMFALQNNTKTTNLELPNLKIENIELENSTAKFDLSMDITESNGELQVSLEYVTDLFSEVYIKSMIEHFKILLEAIVKDEKQTLSHYPLLTKAEEQQLLVEYTNTKVKYPKERCIHQLFEEQAELNPNNIAVVYENRELTYKELNSKSNQLAHYLLEQGVEPDSLVAICVDRSFDMIIGLLAILKAGGAYVPIDSSYPQDRIKYILEDSSAKLLLTQEHLKEILSKSKTIIIDTLDTTDYKNSNPKIEVTPSSLAYVIYTSGSTGLPKGVMVEHNGVVNRLDWMQKEYQFNTNDIVLQKTPFSFDVSVWELFLPLMYGLKEVIAKPQGHKDSEYLATLINKEKVTIIHFVPSMLSTIYDYPKFVKIKSLKHIITSGEALSLELVNRYYKYNSVTIHNLYGPTEASIDVTAFSTYKNMPYNTVPIGRSINNTQLYILDKHLNLVPKGVIGELHIAGDGVARGYLNQLELTKEKFIDNPFGKDTKLYKTGDLVRYLEDGNIEYIGRVDDQVKIRGFRIELGEIEQQLLQLEEIKDSIVLAKEDKSGNKSLIAYITVNQEIEDSSIKATLAKHLPDYMIPVAYKTIEFMPLTPNGKVDKKALAKLEIEIQSTKEYIAPRDEIEEKLAQIFQEVLNVERVGIYDNFFELGGHSLLATQLVSKIRSELATELPLHYLFREATIASLYTYLTEGKKYDIVVPLNEEGKKVPIIALHGLGGNAQQFRELSNLLGKEQPIYALQDTALTGEIEVSGDIHTIAKEYVEEIIAVRNQDSYKLIGHSLGGLVAYEMASILQKRGYVVESLILLDCYIPNSDNVKYNLDIIKDKANELNIDFSEKNYLKLMDIYKSYRPQNLKEDCKVTLYMATQREQEYYMKNCNLWKKINKSIQIKDISGNHFSILQGDSLEMIDI
ncbi:Malonyl CoA-acyl carrier protein transacylase [hydrothermal vent metagenome]|uniref:Malonyl CoA-acyl carrier protein transacylase n=1 Tax=hydrothermal vent metagenome TaxID=652676 RepID=A0A1W1CGL8_9ZZZZ